MKDRNLPPTDGGENPGTDARALTGEYRSSVPETAEIRQIADRTRIPTAERSHSIGREYRYNSPLSGDFLGRLLASDGIPLESMTEQ